MRMKSESAIRAVIGFFSFFALLVITARMGILLRDAEYIQLVTIMIAGFMAGGRK